MTGKITGVGVGPGDAELLTLKAVRLIKEADVLAYTEDTNGKSTARQIAAAYILPDQEELALRFSMSPDHETRKQARRQAAGQVAELLNAGKHVVFITEGDPLLYSTFQHLLAELPAQVTCEVCPGVSAMTATAASAGFPLAIEGQPLTVSPAETAIGNLQSWLSLGHTLVLFKVARCLDRLAAELAQVTCPWEAVLVERASTDQEIIHRDVTRWPEVQASYFSIVLIRPTEWGKTAA